MRDGSDPCFLSYFFFAQDVLLIFISSSKTKRERAMEQINPKPYGRLVPLSLLACRPATHFGLRHAIPSGAPGRCPTKRHHQDQWVIIQPK